MGVGTAKKVISVSKIAFLRLVVNSIFFKDFSRRSFIRGSEKPGFPFLRFLILFLSIFVIKWGLSREGQYLGRKI